MPEESLEFRDLTEDEFRQSFLESANAGDQFFNQFKYIYDLNHGNPASALDQGMTLLNKCHSIDANVFAQIHKGSAYYWIGIAAFLVHDYELAAFFFDAAMSEDLRAGADPIINPTPAFRFMLIDGQPPEQAARQLVQVTQARVQELINDYNLRPGRLAGNVPLTIEELRRRFLIKAISPRGEAWRSPVTTFISFSLEWDYRNLLFDI